MKLIRSCDVFKRQYGSYKCIYELCQAYFRVVQSCVVTAYYQYNQYH